MGEHVRQPAKSRTSDSLQIFCVIHLSAMLNPSDSPLNEEEMEVTTNVIDFFYAGKAGFRTKVSKSWME